MLEEGDSNEVLTPVVNENVDVVVLHKCIDMSSLTNFPRVKKIPFISTFDSHEIVTLSIFLSGNSTSHAHNGIQMNLNFRTINQNFYKT